MGSAEPHGRDELNGFIIEVKEQRVSEGWHQGQTVLENSLKLQLYNALPVYSLYFLCCLHFVFLYFLCSPQVLNYCTFSTSLYAVCTFCVIWTSFVLPAPTVCYLQFLFTLCTSCQLCNPVLSALPTFLYTSSVPFFPQLLTANQIFQGQRL